MKRWLALGAVLMILTAGCSLSRPITPAPPGPAPMPAPSPAEDPFPKGFTPSGLAFWDEQHGLVAGQSDGKGLIARTEDGGKTWKVVYQGGTRIVGLTAPAGSQEAWAGLVSCGGQGGSDCAAVVLHTEDGGAHWPPLAERVTSPSFADAKTGWALPGGAGKPWTEDGTPAILSTSDGGHAWKPMASPCKEKGFGTVAVSLATPNEGWVGCAGQPGAGQQMKALYATADGGKTWSEVKGLGGGGYLSGITFRASGSGWVWMSRGGMLATADGGKTWKSLEPVQPEVKEAWDARFLSDTVGFVLVRDNEDRQFKLAKTTDGGSHLSELYRWPID